VKWVLARLRYNRVYSIGTALYIYIFHSGNSFMEFFKEKEVNLINSPGGWLGNIGWL